MIMVFCFMVVRVGLLMRCCVVFVSGMCRVRMLVCVMVFGILMSLYFVLCMVLGVVYGLVMMMWNFRVWYLWVMMELMCLNLSMVMVVVDGCIVSGCVLIVF